MVIVNNKRSKNVYRHLDVEHIHKTLENLHDRINDRFPDANLLKVSAELLGLVEEIKNRTQEISQPVWTLRALSGVLTLGLVALIIVLIVMPFWSLISQSSEITDFGDFLQGVEAVISGLFLLGLAIVYFVSTELRQKRKRVLEAIHELRAIAHVVDMHQLTKDPGYVMYPDAPTTPASPERPNWDEFELIRYLEYCSEILAIIGKLAACYAQNFNNPIIYDAVNDVENLTSDLSRKIWQKISVMYRSR